MSRPYTYKVTVAPQKDAVTLETFKKHIKRSSSTSEDLLLDMYLKSAIRYAEGLTRRDFITRTYLTYRDFFPVACQNEGYYEFGYIPNYRGSSNGVASNVGFEIRRSPLQSVTQIQYYVKGVLTTVDSSTYYITEESDYSSILAISDWPYDCDNRIQSIQITFLCGFGDNDTDVPMDIREAILQLATALWIKRGDCDGGACSKAIPSAAKIILLQNRIENL